MIERYDPIIGLVKEEKDSEEEWFDEFKVNETPGKLENSQLLQFMQDYADKQEEWEQNRFNLLQKLGGEEFEKLQDEIHKNQRRQNDKDRKLSKLEIIKKEQ